MTVPSPDARRVAAEAAMRENLYLFLVGAFKILFPGETLTRAEYVEAMCYALQRVASGRMPSPDHLGRAPASQVDLRLGRSCRPSCSDATRARRSSS